jgi:hypothetical protein
MEQAVGADGLKTILGNTDAKIFTRTISYENARRLSAYKEVIKPKETLSLKDREFYCFGSEGGFRGGVRLLAHRA